MPGNTQFLFSATTTSARHAAHGPTAEAAEHGRSGGWSVGEKLRPASPGELDFAAEHRHLQQESVAAFRETIADVHAGRFPERGHPVEMEAPILDEVVL